MYMFFLILRNMSMFLKGKVKTVHKVPVFHYVESEVLQKMIEYQDRLTA